MSPLPCPFCGGDRVISAAGKDCARPYFVRCDDITCMGFNTAHGFATPEEAIEAWNRRAPAESSIVTRVVAFFGVAKRTLIRGELLEFQLEDNGRLRCDVIDFDKSSPRFAVRST